MQTTRHNPGPPRTTSNDEQVERLFAELGRSTEESERRRLRAEIVERMLGVADAVAHRYWRWGLDEEDLQQVARTALVAAVDRYRVGRGHGFVAFAVPTITGELLHYYRDQAWVVRPPRPVQERRIRLWTVEPALQQRLAGTVSLGDLARALGCGIDEVRAARSCSSGLHPVSLESPAHDGGTIGDAVPVEGDDYTDLETHLVLVELVRRRTTLERRVLELRFVEELTQREIAAATGMGQVQVSRMLRRILTELREGLGQRVA